MQIPVFRSDDAGTIDVVGEGYDVPLCPVLVIVVPCEELLCIGDVVAKEESEVLCGVSCDGLDSLCLGRLVFSDGEFYAKTFGCAWEHSEVVLALREGLACWFESDCL